MPEFKRLWVMNELGRYQRFEGITKNLPGRLTPELVSKKLEELRAYQAAHA